MNGEEVKEMLDTAVNLIFIAAVLFVGLMFFGLRADYANIVAERQASELRMSMENRYKEYNFAKVSGYEVMRAITAYSKDVPMYVTGAYNFAYDSADNSEDDDGAIATNLIYDKNNQYKDKAWGKVSTSLDPRTDQYGLQAVYRKESVYFAILTYDSDSPDQLARDMGLDTQAGRDAGTFNTKTDNKVKWITNKYNAVRPNGNNGYTVSGILFICLHLEGVSPTSEQYKQVAIY